MIEKVFAQEPVDLGGTIGGNGLGPFSNVSGGVGGAVESLKNITSAVSSVIGVMTIAAGIWFIFNFIVGGIQWVSAGGDKNNLQNAQQKIQSALVGLIIVVVGWTMLALAGKFFGFDILITNPRQLIDQLSPT
jgi:hypothetical protein